MKLTDLYPSRYLKAEDIKGKDRTLTIKGITMEPLGQEKDEKPVLTFTNSDKQLVLNKTNGLVVASLYGEDTDAWIGKHITIFATRVPFGGKLVDSIRVRERAAAAPTAGDEDLPF